MKIFTLFYLGILLNFYPSSTLALPSAANGDVRQPGVLIGDLRFKQTTPVGRSVAKILLGTEAGQSRITGPGPTGDCSTSTDPCCVWYTVSESLTSAFLGGDGQCNDLARAAIRLGFHDAGTWSQKLADAGQDFGGADGSLVLFGEITRTENKGLEQIVKFVRAHQSMHNVGMADLIQYAAIHAIVTCPGGPRIRTFVGRKDATKAAPLNLLPSVTSSADVLIALFAEKTIQAHDLTALVGAHSTSKQFSQDHAHPGTPQDTTPGIWDVRFYNETLRSKAKPGTFRFPSDMAIAADRRCSGDWKSFVGNPTRWNADFAAAYVRLSMLGVNNINALQECTATLPLGKKVPGEAKDMFMNE